MWKKVSDELPEQNQKIEVVAFEFGCEPIHIAAEFWQSSEKGQPPKFYCDNDET